MTWAVFICGSVWILVKAGKDLHSLQEFGYRWSNDKSAGPHTTLLIQQLKDKQATILSAQLYKWWSAGKQPTHNHSAKALQGQCRSTMFRVLDHWPSCTWLWGCKQNTYPAGHSGVFISSQSSSTQWVSPTRKVKSEFKTYTYIYMWTQPQVSEKISKKIKSSSC